MNAGSREVCRHCRRPRAVCYCSHLAVQATRTRVVFLQHPREAKVPIGTARMAHLMLQNSELHKGVLFATHPRILELVADPFAALLFPGEGAQNPESLDAGSVRTLVVIDGTWAQARKVLKENPILNRLPRIGLTPTTPGNYRIRREPRADCLATIEAVVSALGALEREPERFASMLTAFTYMVDRQLELAAARQSPPRRWKSRIVTALTDARLCEQLTHAVVLHAEVNAHARGQNVPGQPELLHLYARRLLTGETFQAVIAPTRPLSPSAAFHLDLAEAQILAGEPLAAAIMRWKSFVKPHDILCGWGQFTREKLIAEGAGDGAWLDLRLLVARKLQTSPGSPALAARNLNAAAAESTAPGRAGKTVVELERIVTALRRDYAKPAATQTAAGFSA